MENIYNENDYQTDETRIGTAFAPPPDFTPIKTPELYKTEPFQIRSCKGKYTYIWLKNGRSFWVYITNAGRNTVSGYKWKTFGWTLFGVSLKNLESFYCMDQ